MFIPRAFKDQAYVILRIRDRQKAPHSILLESGAGEIVKRALPAA